MATQTCADVDGSGNGDGHTHTAASVGHSQHRQQQQKEEGVRPRQLPVTVITGFLGSGKTTLLQYILNNKSHGMRVAVINNEFVASNLVKLGVSSEMGELKESAASTLVAEADIYETNSGCLCCGGGANDFMKILWQLSSHKDKIDYVLVETTGLADPSFTNSFFIDERLKEHFYLDGIVTLVDAKNANFELSRTATTSSTSTSAPSKSTSSKVLSEFREQIAIADRLVINKIDLISETEIEALERQIRTINSFAPLTRTEYSRVGDLTPFLAAKSFDLQRVLARDSTFLDDRSGRGSVHDPTIVSVCLMGAGRLPRQLFVGWLKHILQRYPREILRSKGCVALDDSPDVHIFQGVHDLLDITARYGVSPAGIQSSAAVASPTVDQDVNRLIFIVRDAEANFGEILLESFHTAINGSAHVDDKSKRITFRLLTADEEPPAPALMKLMLVVALMLFLFNSKAGSAIVAWLQSLPMFTIGVISLVILVGVLVFGQIKRDRQFNSQLAARKQRNDQQSCAAS